MGLNAQTSVPTFTAGEVLTAANMNISARTGIPVFAGTTERDAAFGGTGEKTLAEGQYAYLESTNQTLVYDGANWVSVGVTPGLVLVKTQTIGSAVSTVTVTGAFSSTYENYKITINGMAHSASGGTHNFQLGGSTGSTYSGSFVYINSVSSGLVSSNVNNGTTAVISITNTTKNGITLDVLGPNLVEATQIVGLNSGYSASSTSYGGTSLFTDGNAAASTAFTISSSAGTMTGGTIRVYGYSNS